MESGEAAILNEAEGNVVSGEQYEECKVDENVQAYTDSNGQTESKMEQLTSWLEMCRVCANLNDHIVPIFEAEGAEHELSKKIHKYLPIRVHKTDTLPVQLCYHCAATILAWHELLEGCLDAEKRLLQLQAEQNSREKAQTKYSENLSSLSEELIDDPEPVVMEEPESNLIEQQEEETNYGDSSIGDEATKRLKEANNDAEAESEPLDTVAPIKTHAYYKKLSRVASMEKNEKIDISSFCSNRPKRKCTQKPVDEKNDTLVLESKKNKPISEDPYVCWLCDKKFRLRHSLKCHLRIHTGEKHFTCHICGKQFAQTGCLYYHLRHVHAGVKNHSCDICGRSFAMKTAMEDHRRSIHTHERPYICDSCGKTFKTKSSLYIHSRIHTETFPHECKYCNKPFRWKQQLIGHLTIHTGEKNHTCDLCGKSFGMKNYLTRHKRTHIIEKPYMCDKCGMIFRQKRYLASHERSRHG